MGKNVNTENDIEITLCNVIKSRKFSDIGITKNNDKKIGHPLLIRKFCGNVPNTLKSSAYLKYTSESNVIGISNGKYISLNIIPKLNIRIIVPISFDDMVLELFRK